MFLKLITFKQHTFLFLKNTKKLDWIYWKKLLLQGLATLFFIGLVSYRSSHKKWIIWEYLSLKNEENSRTISIKKRLLGLIKEIAFLLQWIIAPIFWKIRYYYTSIFFLRKRKWTKTWQNIQYEFSHVNICLHNHIFIRAHIACGRIHLTPGTLYSVMNVRVAAQVFSNTQLSIKFRSIF